MSYTTVFKRYEMKYMMTEEQVKRLLLLIEPYMTADRYGKSTVRNIYFDTDSYRLIRRSTEKPTYKEKLRVRSYSQATADSTVFVEIKKKYKHVVYKRRISLAHSDAVDWLEMGQKCVKDTQISREIDYFIGYYGDLRPTVFLSYEREAYVCKDGSDFRITLDRNVLARTEDLSLSSPVGGKPLLRDGEVLMELKCSGGIPMWMARFLSKERIFKTSFSKYGTAYQTMIFPNISDSFKEGTTNVS